MKQSKFVPVVVLILVFAFILPASAMYDPRDNEQPLRRIIDDHPWGGDAVPTHDGIDRSGAPVEFIDIPFIYIDFYNIIIIGDFPNVKDSDQSDIILPEDYNDSQSNNHNLPTRGY
jgi:hypothetical protein